MMRTQQEVQARVIARAAQLAAAQGYGGPGRFTMKHYRQALAELPPREREAERGLAPPPLTDGEHLVHECRRAGMTDEAISQKLDRLAREHPQTYKQYTFPAESLRPTAGEALADRMAALVRDYAVRPSIARAVVLAADPELKAAVANVPSANLVQAERERQHFAKLTSSNPARSYATAQPANPWHQVLPLLLRDELVRLVAKGVLTDSDITEWCVVNVMGGKKPIGLSPGLAGESQAWDDKLNAAVRAITDEAQLLKIREGGRSA